MVGQVERDREVNLFNETTTTIYYYLVYITFTKLSFQRENSLKAYVTKNRIKKKKKNSFKVLPTIKTFFFFLSLLTEFLIIRVFEDSRNSIEKEAIHCVSSISCEKITFVRFR